MKGKISLSGLDAVLNGINAAAKRVVDGGKRVIYSEADTIVHEAQLNAPVDKHNLEKAITRDKGSLRGFRFVITISVGGFVGDVDVTKYALLIHENYSSMKPGPGTLQKRQQNPGRYVGEKFLERALNDRRGRLIRVVGQFVDKEWRL